MNVLYVFSGERAERFKGRFGSDFPDTQFYGMNHLTKFGIHAEYKEFERLWGGRILKKILGFRIKHTLMFFLGFHYDIVFGISVLYMLWWKKIIPTKTKHIIFDSNLNRILTKYPEGSLKRKILLLFLREANGIVFLSGNQKNRFLKQVPELKEKVYTVRMGVDKTFFKYQRDGREDFLLAVGRDNARDYKTLIDAARLLPQKEFRIVCLPRNIEGIEDIPQNVKVYTEIPLQTLKEFFSKAQALLMILHDDSYTDGSDSSGPTVFLEAMASGLPVIISKKGYVSDYIENRKNALLVDFYDVSGIVHSIEELGSPETRDRLAREARYVVDTTLNTEIMAKSLASIFTEVYER